MTNDTHTTPTINGLRLVSPDLDTLTYDSEGREVLECAGVETDA